MSEADHPRPCSSRPIFALAAVAAAFVLAFSQLGCHLAGETIRRQATLTASKSPHTGREVPESLPTPHLEQPKVHLSLAEGSQSSPKPRVRLNHFKNAIDLTLPNVSAIVRTYEGDGPKFLPLLMSLLAAAEGHVNLNVITVNVERAGRERLQDAVAHVNELCERPSVHLELDWVYEGNHVPEKNAMYGYDATDAMLSRILKETRNQRDAGGWLLVTNGDNLYASAFFEAVKQHMNGPAAVIATRFLTRYPMPTEFGQVANVPLSPAPHMNEIDLGCYVSRMSRIRELGVNFVNNTANIRGADGLFAEKLKPDGEKFVMIPRILFYHQ